jgi:hypothetical protein
VNLLKCLFPLLFIFPTIVFAQKETSNLTLLPKGRLFSEITYDPTESQAYGSIVAFWENDEFSKNIYLPFGMGFYKGFLRWNREKPFEIGFDFSAHTQFEWTFNNGRSERNILNSDFKVSIMLNRQLNDRHSYRLRFYHVSSHLGDDYIIRNQVTSYFPNPNNYEQLDFIWSTQFKDVRYYGGIGLVVRPETIRKRLSLQIGTQYDHSFSSNQLFGLTGGMDLKLLEEHDFHPGVKAAFGFRIGRAENHPLRIVGEFYRGHLPYSAFESKRVQWLGAGLYFLP